MPATEFSDSMAVSGPDRIAAFLEIPNLFRFFEYWCSKRDGRVVPARTDIDPIDIPWALPWTFLMDFSAPDVFRYRLAGQQLVDVFGYKLKGRTLEEVVPKGAWPSVSARWMPIVDQRAVVCMKGLVYQARDRLPIGERILLPLADDPDGPVTGLVGMTVYRLVATDEIRAAQPPSVLTVPATQID